MDYEKIKLAILDVYKKCGTQSFPIDCIKVLEAYKMKIKKYSEQSPKLLLQCMEYSEDAFTAKKTIYYNDKTLPMRIRFSLAHEIGHIALHHTDPRTDIHEKESDIFASHLLAPRMAIHYAGCKNENDVAKTFNISHEAAQIAFNDYRRWHRWTVYHKMNEFDKAMYAHFYNKDAKCFVYNIKKCAYCESEIYNANDVVCKKCNTPSHAYLSRQVLEDDFVIAESQWLYSGL